MFDRSLLNPMLSGPKLYDALRMIPEFDESVRNMDKSSRLIALSDLYNIYLPCKMSEEIYTKLYLALVRSLNKKTTSNAVRQSNENFKAIRLLNSRGIIGGSDSFSIIGCSGIGKSSAVSRAVDLITDKRYIEYNNIKICPVIIVQCPFDSSVKGLVLEVLRTIDSVLCTKYYANAIRSRATTDVLIGIVSQVALHHIGLLIIDEIQHCVNSRNGKTLINSLTQIINNTGVSICLIGTPECKAFFSQGLQLARRSMGLSYNPLPFDDFFEEMCRVVFDYQYTLNRTELTGSMIEWLYEHSGGLVSLLISLIHDAQEIAILSETEKLDLKSLNEAYRKRSAMVHVFLQNGIRSLPSTGRNSRINKQTMIGKEFVLEEETTQEGCSGLSPEYSISEIVIQAKKNEYDVVESLKQYIKVEVISKEG